MARTPIHPGEILSDELLEIGISAKKLAQILEVRRIACIRSWVAPGMLRRTPHSGWGGTSERRLTSG